MSKLFLVSLFILEDIDANVLLHAVCLTCVKKPIRENLGMWPAALNHEIDMTVFRVIISSDTLLKLCEKGIGYGSFVKLLFSGFYSHTPQTCCM